MLILLWLLVSPRLHAHPHMFIDTRVTVVFDGNGLTGFRINWIFDKVFSAAVVQDYDGNGDEKFSQEEINAVKEGAFSNLRNYNYFCYITVQGSEFPVQYVTNFIVRLEQGRISYNFFVPCHVRATTSYKTVTIAVYDETYFTDISFERQSPVLIENENVFQCSFKLVENKKRTYWGGQIIPKEIRVQFRKKQ